MVSEGVVNEGGNVTGEDFDKQGGKVVGYDDFFKEGGFLPVTVKDAVGVQHALSEMVLKEGLMAMAYGPDRREAQLQSKLPIDFVNCALGEELERCWE